MNFKTNNKICLSAAILAACFSQSVSATIIADGYEGASSVKSGGGSYGDVIGSTSNFQINNMDVSLSGTVLTVKIDTTFGGKGDNGLFSGSTATALSASKGIGYGDLFLSSAWTPFGSAPYAGDNNANGTTWSYGFSLDDRWGVENVTHGGTLYSLNSGDNNTDTYLSDDFLSTSDFYYRNGQEMAVDTVNGDVTAVNTGSWDTKANEVNFEIDLAGTGLLLGDEIAFHWGMTCGNDTIEGAIDNPYNVPAPSILGLLSLGLFGIGLQRRKRS